MQTLFPFAAGAANGSSSNPSPKINITTGPLPPFISASQAPTKKAPWRTVRSEGAGFIKSVTIAVPEELGRRIWQSGDAKDAGKMEIEGVRNVRYAKVYLNLEQVLSGDFFTQYIKRGNVLMLSEGEPGVDNFVSLKDGVLRIELAKEVYERTGLQGTPVRSGGRKHIKSRYLVEYNLRLPSMLHGKKGFERLAWAAKNVLNDSLQWLFLDLNDEYTADLKGPITAHHPIIIDNLTPSVKTISNVLVPSSLVTNLVAEPNLTGATASTSNIKPPTPRISEELQESISDLFEYIDMLTLASPRVQGTDHVDPFISRYQVPDPCNTSQAGSATSEKPRGETVTVMTWTGLIPVQWVLGLLCAVIKQSRRNQSSEQTDWLALTVSAHKTRAVGQLDGYTIVLQPDCPGSETLEGHDEHTPVEEARDKRPSGPEQDSTSAKRARLHRDPSTMDDGVGDTNQATTLDGLGDDDATPSKAQGDKMDTEMTDPPDSSKTEAISEGSEAAPRPAAEQTQSSRQLAADLGNDRGLTTATATAAIPTKASTTSSMNPTSPAINGPSLVSRAGFQKYICAEYIDSVGRW